MLNYCWEIIQVYFKNDGPFDMFHDVSGEESLYQVSFSNNCKDTHKAPVSPCSV